MKATSANLRDYIQSYTDFPKPGVVYWDFTPLLAEPAALKQAIGRISDHFTASGITRIAAIEAKGFTLGSCLAYAMDKPLLLIRKPELVPGEVDSEKFEKEYGFGEYQLKSGQLGQGDSVLIVYDIMAGAGAARAAINLVSRAGAKIAGLAFAIELGYLGGREQLAEYDLFSLVTIASKPMP